MHGQNDECVSYVPNLNIRVTVKRTNVEVKQNNSSDESAGLPLVFKKRQNNEKYGMKL